MAAPTGNKFWRKRLRDGRKPCFSSAGALEDACLEYFDWVEANPLTITEVTRSQGEVGTIKVPRPRPMTIQGLCLHLGITMQTWTQYRKKSEGFSEVTEWADMVIRTQKFEGAAANLFNANIISRDLGLADKQQTETTIAANDSLSTLMEQIAKNGLDLKSG